LVYICNSFIFPKAYWFVFYGPHCITVANSLFTCEIFQKHNFRLVIYSIAVVEHAVIPAVQFALFYGRQNIISVVVFLL